MCTELDSGLEVNLREQDACVLELGYGSEVQLRDQDHVY